MIKLSGILEYSMGGFLCLRGFASFKMLSAISKPKDNVQRDLIAAHKGEMARFLNDGEYKFFPEVILATNLTDGTKDFDEVDLFHESLQSGQTWNKSIGNFQFNISRNASKNILNQYDRSPRIERIYLAHIKFDESTCELLRIDGNHRLSAADEVIDDFTVPFCLLLFRNPKENDQYSRAIFHNINAKQKPLKLEENLRVILESDEVFTDAKLRDDPSFGWEYYLARKVLKMDVLGKYPFADSLIRGWECTYLRETFHELLKCNHLKADEESAEIFVKQLPEIEEALQEAHLHSVPQNMAVVGTLTFYKLTDSQKYTQFISWIKKNCIAEAPNIHMEDLISIYDKIYENTPKNVFMSMWFSDKTMDTYQTLKDVKEILKRENGIDFRIIKVDEHKDGYSDEIYHRIVDGIEASSLVIADLSYGNKNVHHEIGYAQGRGKKVLLLYQIRDGVDAKTEIGSNISMHDQVRFKNQTELRPMLLRRIRHFFGVETTE